MHWYEKLSRYFPIEEMKSRKHIEMLLEEKPELYVKDEGENYVLMYAEFENFLFVDYLLVSKEARGQGLGSKLMEKLKAKNKPIILEVEPVSYEDTDTVKRRKFYERIGFKQAEMIGYRRRSLATGEVTELEILYWSPTDESEQSIYEKMIEVYEKIHTYKDEELYGETYQPAEDVLEVKELH